MTTFINTTCLSWYLEIHISDTLVMVINCQKKFEHREEKKAQLLNTIWGYYNQLMSKSYRIVSFWSIRFKDIVTIFKFLVI